MIREAITRNHSRSALLTFVVAFAIEGAAVAQHRANPLRYTVAPSVPTEITMATLPNASCALHRENDAVLIVFAFSSVVKFVSLGFRPCVAWRG